MRDKIAEFLKAAGRPLPAEEILRGALHIQAPNSATAGTLLKSIFGTDPRFRRRRGFWQLMVATSPEPLKAVALILRWNRAKPSCFRGAVHFPDTGLCVNFLRVNRSGTEYLQLLRRARHQAENRLLLVWQAQMVTRWNQLLRLSGLPEWRGDALAVSRLAGRVLPAEHAKDLEDLAPLLGIAPPDVEDPASLARFLAAAYRGLLDLVPEEHRVSLAEIERWIDAGMARVDFSRFGFGRDLLTGLPEGPGVYLMRNRAGDVIYVGKSANLRRRVRSYFHAGALSDPKVTRIHSMLYTLEALTCRTEVEALLLEIRMIRDFRPPINLQAEVHEQTNCYGHGRNLLILVSVGEAVEVCFLKDGAFAAQQAVAFGSAPGKRLRSRIKNVFFRGSNMCRNSPKEPWECEIVSRWLSRNRKRLNCVDVDESGDLDSVMRRLESYLNDPDRLKHKVYFR